MIKIENINNFTNFDFKGLSQLLMSLSPIEMAALSSIVGTLCSIPLNTLELNVVGNFLQAVGQIMCVAQAQSSLINANQPNQEFINYKNEIDYKLNKIIKELNIKIK